jgi:hypothetical protein
LLIKRAQLPAQIESAVIDPLRGIFRQPEIILDHGARRAGLTGRHHGG